MVKNEEGEFEYAVAIQRDITDRKEVENTLFQSNKQFKIIMDSLEAFVYVSDMDTYELLYTNKKVKENFGNIEGKICWQEIQSNQKGPCDFCTNDKLLTKTGRPQKPYKWEFQNTTTKKWYLLADRAIKWHDGRMVRLEIASDITERKQAETALIESEEKFRNIFENMDNGYILSDLEGNIQLVNLSTVKILGYIEENDLMGKNTNKTLLEFLQKNGHGKKSCCLILNFF